MPVYSESEHTDGWLMLRLCPYFSIFNKLLSLLLIGRSNCTASGTTVWRRHQHVSSIAISLHCTPSTSEFRGGRGSIWAQEEKWGFLGRKSVLLVCVHRRMGLPCAITITPWVRPDEDMSGISGRQWCGILQICGLRGEAGVIREGGEKENQWQEWPGPPNLSWAVQSLPCGPSLACPPSWLPHLLAHLQE